MNFNSGDTAWMLVATAMVLFMTPGLAIFYSGMIRGKNVLGMLAQNFIVMGTTTIVWLFVAYSLAFSGTGKWIGDLHQVGFRNITEMPTGIALTFPPIVFAAFQMMFAMITPALITGAIADRMKFSSWIVFSIAWLIVVYAPIAHWVFSPSGWLYKLGVEDFAGGTVVEANAGASAIAIAIVLGARKGWPRESMRPHSVPFVLLGAGILWFGWFGFNAGSALAANETSAFAFVNTNIAGAAGLLGWMGWERYKNGHPTTLGAASGAIAGLVAITPSCGFISPMASALVGVAAGIVCASAITIKHRVNIDDSLDVFGVHLVAGVLGTLFIGFVSINSFNHSATKGLLNGGGVALLEHQLIAVIAVIAYAFIATFLLAHLIKRTIGLRVTPDDESRGLDLSQHMETAYDMTTYGEGARFSSGIFKS